MGICQSFDRKRNPIIKINKYEEKDENKNLSIHNKEVQITNFQTVMSDLSSPQTNILSFPNEKYIQAPSTLSLNSNTTRIDTSHSSRNFNIEATIGEIEIPIFVEKNENIIININDNNNNIQNCWSFLKNEKPVDYLGYPQYKYKNINIGAMFLRIRGSQQIYLLNSKRNSFKANSKGSLLFWAHLNPNDYQIYEPKGTIQITIIGGNHIYEKELNPYFNINNENEKKIIQYVNKARNNILGIVNDYFNINENEMNQELINYINKNNFKRKELVYDKELNNIAKEHCEYLCSYGTTGETDKDGLNIKDKIKKKCNIFFTSVNIIYGINNPLLIVKRMVLDKYSKSKINRNNLLFHGINKVGICLREHLAYKFCCVISFSE